MEAYILYSTSEGSSHWDEELDTFTSLQSFFADFVNKPSRRLQKERKKKQKKTNERKEEQEKRFSFSLTPC